MIAGRISAAKGLHAKSEIECIDIFDKVKNVFEYVFGNLRVQTEDARNVVKSLANLQQSLPQKQGSKANENTGNLS
jgi:hypothetical protein